MINILTSSVFLIVCLYSNLADQNRKTKVNTIRQPTQTIGTYDELLSNPLEQYNFNEQKYDDCYIASLPSSGFNLQNVSLDNAYNDCYVASPSTSTIKLQTVSPDNTDKKLTEIKTIILAQEIKIDNLTNELVKISTKLEKLLCMQECGSYSYVEQIGKSKFDEFDFPLTSSEAVSSFNQFCSPENKQQLQSLVS